mgnify:CR=1 FL=1
MKIINIGTMRELFADDFLIDKMLNVRLDLKHPERREVFEFDAPWEDNAAFPYSLVSDKNIVRLYYRAATLDLKNEDHTTVVAIAESTDNGISFTRPHVGKFEFKNSKKNNIVSIGFPGVPPAFIDKNPNCKEEEKYKGFASTWGRLYALCSADGINWHKMQEEPLVYSGAFDTINTAFWDTVTSCYRSYTRAWVNVETAEGLAKIRVIQSATSQDFIHWTSPVYNEYFDGQEDVQLYTNATQPCPGAEHIYLSFPCRFMERRRRGIFEDDGMPSWTRHGCNDGLFMVSRDGVHWQRYLDAWVRPGLDERNWGQRNNYPVWGIVLTSDREWSMYVSEHYMQKDVPTRFCRLSIRPWGFVSVHADYSGGEFTTKPLTFSGDYLRLNYATSAAGSIRVEIQDESGKAIEGFGFDDMAPLFGDEVDGGVMWKKGSDLSALRGKPVRLRFVMKDADLFALRFASDKNTVSICEILPLPRYTYRIKATCSEVHVLPLKNSIIIDGDIDEWDFSKAVKISPPPEFAEKYNARIALMYDSGALYVAGDVADPFPMKNMNSFDSDMRNSWSSDALQLHIQAISDSPDTVMNDVRLWYSTKDKMAGCYIIAGNSTENKGVLNPQHVKGAYKIRKDGQGYTFEFCIPWIALNSTRAPYKGERVTACIQCHWGTEKGDNILCGAVDVRKDSKKEPYEQQSWGWAVFE